MNDQKLKTLCLLLGIGLVLALGAAGKLYTDLATYRANQAEFSEYQKTKTEQQEKLDKLLQDNEKMLRDITEINNLEKKLRRAIIRDTDANKLGSSLGTSTSLETAPSSGYTAKGGSKGAMTGLVAMQTLEAQNKNIQQLLTSSKQSVSELLGEMEGRSGTLAAFPDRWPTEGGVITSVYGSRMDPIAFGTEFHEGIDIAVEFGTPIYASGAGTVEQAGRNGGYGNYIRINHGNGYQTAYGHMSALVAREGQQIAKGEIIGFAGSTGYSTGPHLHFEVLSEGMNIDPYFVIKR